MPENDSNIRAVERALHILKCFKPGKLELTLTEIAAEVALPRSTTFRLLSNLECHRVLIRNKETKKYYLGAEIARLGSLCYSNLDYRKVALPLMIELRDLYNESVSLYIAENDKQVCIERIESTHPLRRVINIGDQLPLTLGAAGRLLLAYMDGMHMEKTARQYKPIAFETQERLRKLGYAVSRGKRDAGVTSIAVPIFNPQKRVVLALSLSGPTDRFKAEDMPERIKMLQHYAKMISAALGYQP